MPHFNVSGSALSLHTQAFSNLLPKTTLFIHGNLASNNWWMPSMEVWKTRAKGSNWTGSMVLAEFPGCGKSSAPTQASDVDMDKFADHFIALTEAMNNGSYETKAPSPINLVGHSTGGLICALMAAKRPDLFDRVVMLDPVGARGVTFDDSMLGAFEQMKTNKELTAVVIGGTIKDNDASKPFFKETLVNDAFHAVQTTGPWVLLALRHFDARERLKKSQAHALVLHGEHDTLLPMEDSKELASLMKAQFKVMPGQGHCSNVENPEHFVEVAHSFLFS